MKKTLNIVFSSSTDEASCIVKNEKGNVVTEAKVKRYKKDAPNSETGKKFAFQKAMNQLIEKPNSGLSFSKNEMTISFS